MKVTGFTFIKNALIYDYPIVEAITSILPICDAFVVAVGKSDDATLAMIQGIAPDKIRIVETEWNEQLREGGRVLAAETDKAYAAIAEDTDWAFYIQGDEVVHEKYLEIIKAVMLRYKDDVRVDGLLFDYLHFYGSYDYYGASAQWYSHEIRVVRKNKSIYSYRDAQGFRKGDNEKLSVKKIEACVYHYGWVKEPKAMQRKQQNFNKLWHDDAWVEQYVGKAEEFDYSGNLNYLHLFTDSHPKVMEARIAAKNWVFETDLSFDKRTLKDKVKAFFKRYLGIQLGYKNYRVILCF